MALRLSGMAAKNFALFVYAVLKDQKKTHGKTRLVRMLREQRPFKFFNVPTAHMKEFVKEAKKHGLLYVPIRNKRKASHIEIVVFADDASKIQRIYDNLGLDFVRAQAGEANVEKEPIIENAISTVPAPSKAETVHSEQSTTELKADEKSTENSSEVNFTLGWEKALEEPAMEKNLSGTSSPSKSSWPGLTNHKESSGKPSVKKLLQEIRREQTEKKAKKAKQQERRYPAPGHSHKKVKKQKGRTSI